jgi:hypothetical protein
MLLPECPKDAGFVGQNDLFAPWFHKAPFSFAGKISTCLENRGTLGVTDVFTMAF